MLQRFAVGLLGSLCVCMGAMAAEENKPAEQQQIKAAQQEECVTAVTVGRKAKNKAVEAAANKAASNTTATLRKWTLNDFLTEDLENNLAVKHPFTVANAAEKTYAMINHVAPRTALDPLYRVKPVKIYPMLSGESDASGGRMIVGQEEAVEAFVNFVGSVARGDRTGKALGFPGPAGTGKTELLYVMSNVEKNLGKLDKYKQYSYRWKGLHKIPFLKYLYKYDRDGNPLTEYFDPDMARSPFTLLRSDMKERVIQNVRPAIKNKWDVVISKGWRTPEPKSKEIIKAILEFKFPDIANGLMTIDDLTQEQYLDALNEFLVIVPKYSIRPPPEEPKIIRAQTDNPNYQALFAQPNVGRAHAYGMSSPLGVDFNGKIFQQDGGLLMLDELFRNPGEFLNILLEVIQNHIAETDFGDPVMLDILPIWNSNDESIDKSAEDNAIKALINRTDSPAMRSLLHANQIESVMMFQIGLDRFKMRKLSETAVNPLIHSEVYPPTDAFGQTHSALGRYALYYDMDGTDILIAPYTLNYMSWLSSASRFVVDMQKISKVAAEINLTRSNPSLLQDPIGRVKITIGDKTPERADLMELSRLRYLVREGETGISARDIETWFKAALEMAKNKGGHVLTPYIADLAFQKLLDEGRIKPGKEEIRAQWQMLREAIKVNLLLPKMDEQVRTIVSGDGQAAERIYDQVEQEFTTIATKPDAKSVVPEDGSQPIIINQSRLTEIRQIYRSKFGRDFDPLFLLRNLRGARRGPAHRDPDLLESVRIFLAQHHAQTTDYTSALDGLWRGETSDPSVRQRAAEIEPLLQAYGYDLNSFKEAVTFVAQLRMAEQLARESQQRRQ